MVVVPTLKYLVLKHGVLGLSQKAYLFHTPLCLKRTQTDSTKFHQLTILSDGKGRFRLEDLTTNEYVVSDQVMVTGKWYHICGVYDSVETKIKVFINGQKTELTASGSAGDTNAPFAIGCNFAAAGDNPANYFDGLIDDCAIWDRALTDAEVLSIYTGGADLRFTTDEAGTEQIPHEVVEWNIEQSTAQVWVKVPEVDADADTVFYVWYDNSTTDAIGRELATSFENFSSSAEIATLLFSTDPNLQGYWKMEDFTDSSPNGYDMTNANSVTFAAGKFNDGGVFNGSNQYGHIAVGSAPGLDIVGSKTVSGWVKMDSGYGSGTLFGGEDSSTDGYLLYIDGGNNNPHWIVRGLTSTVAQSDVVVADSAWYHVCGVYDKENGLLKVFVNGQKTTVATSGTNSANTGNFFNRL